MEYVFRKYSLNQERLYSFLDDLEKSAGSDMVSLYIPRGISAENVEKLILKAGIHQFPNEMLEIIETSGTGAVIFCNEQIIKAMLPAFPVKENVTFTYCNTEPLREIIAKDYRIGVVLVHLGSYAVGYCTGDKLVTSKVGTGLVHGRHKKGGSSQQRFQRRRQKQADEFLERVCGHAVEHLSPHEKELDYIIYGGPRQTVLQLKKKCGFLQSMEERELSVVNVPEIRQPVLEKTVDRIWTSTILEWWGE